MGAVEYQGCLNLIRVKKNLLMQRCVISMDAETAIRLAVKSGKTVLGVKRTLHVLRTGAPRVVVLAGNAPSEIAKEVNMLADTHQVPIHHFRSNSWDLGQICGRPHMVAAMVVLDPGDADIRALTGAGTK